MSKKEPSVTDADLVAFVDNRLPPRQREAIVALARRDADVAARIATLTDGTPALAEPYTALLGGLPSALEDKVRAMAAGPAAAPSRRWFATGLVAASFVIGAVAGGLIMQRRGASEDWREAVAQYHALYGLATTAGLNPPAEEAGRQLAAVSQALGHPLAGIDGLVPGLTFKRAQVLEFEGAPLIQIVFETADKTPVAFCLKRSREAVRAASAESHKGLALASWTRKGVDELVVARLPQEQIMALARQFEGRT
jgi:anti-sigma factor RsiW